LLLKNTAVSVCAWLRTVDVALPSSRTSLWSAV
jgi:hypothetical protein